MVEEKFIFTGGAKKKIIITAIVGLILMIIGIFTFSSGGHGAVEGSVADHVVHWSKRLWVNIWINNVFFTGLAIIGFFFVALQYVSQSGWHVVIQRIPEAFGSWLPIAGGLMIATFLIANHDLFHWTHDYLYDKNDIRYDPIIDGKKGFLNYGFFLARMVVYFVVWYLFYRVIRRESLAEDVNGGLTHYRKMVKFSAIFIVIFGVTSSTSAWDWVMSIDTHWFSTMFGWYLFSSWFVAGLAAIALIVILLKEAGYLQALNTSHIHNLGLYVFAFSIFWTYIWFSQFLLIYYANIPEESIYFVERWHSETYSTYFYLNLVLNFFFPFLVLMTRDSKRQMIIMKIVCIVVLIGHWLDVFLMVTPGPLAKDGGIGFMEIGVTLIYAAAFIFTILTSLSKAPLVPKKHPMLEESVHHHI